MINQEKYEHIIWRLIDTFRNSVPPDSYRPMLSGVLSILWSACKNKSIDIKNADTFKDDINKTIDIIEREDQHLNHILRELLKAEFKHREDILQLINNILERLDSMNMFSSEKIKDIINYLIMKIDLVKGKYESLSITPDAIKELMVGLINPIDNMSVADYFSGSGSILLKVNETFKKYEAKLYGEEINIESYLLSEILLLVNEVSNYTILNKNVYKFENTKENNFDYVLMDAPFSLSLNRPFEANRIFSYGIPSKTRIDWGGYQLALYTLKDKGRAIVTVPTGALFRTSDVKIRKSIIDDDKIEAVVQLPSNLYTNTNIATSIIIFNKNKDDIKKNNIIFIDASNEFLRENRRQNTLTQESIEKIIKAINLNEEIHGFSVIENIDEISNNDYNLNSNVYINNRVIKEDLGKTKVLNEVADVMAGVQINKEDFKTLKNDPTHYYLNVKNIENGELIYDEEDKIRDKKADWYGKYDIKAGDIIITTRGTTIKMLVVPDDFKNSFISNNLSIIRIKQNKYNPYVLLKYLNSSIGKLVLENIQSGSTIMVMNAKKLSEIEIPDYDKNFLESLGERIKKNEIEYKSKLKELERLYHEEDQMLIKELGV